MKIESPHRIKGYLESLPEEYKNLTGHEIIAQCELQVISDLQERDRNDKSVVDRFTGKFLKFLDQDGMFGAPELRVIRIEKVIPYTYDTGWNRQFEIHGEVLTFQSSEIWRRQFKPGDVHSLYSEQDLMKYEIITQAEWFKFDELESSLKEKLTDIIKKESNGTIQ